ncbi:MAG: hypothetical protein J6X27_02130 [Bacteroidaceae bacterium]|nr:hypothetical protein [Bacteroidaceae bacterium]
MDTDFWISVISTMVGVAAIGVALWIASRSSREAKQQIKAVYNLLDVFVAAQNPAIMEAKQKYEQQLAELDEKIDELTEKLDIENTPPPGAPKIDFFEAALEKKALLEQMEGLIKKHDETQLQLDLINAYIDKAKKGKTL